MFKKGKSYASLFILVFLLALFIVGSFAGCEAASLIPIKNRQAIPSESDLVDAEQTAPAETEPLSEEEPASPKEKVIVDKDRCTVRIIDKTVSIYDTQGRLLKTVEKQSGNNSKQSGMANFTPILMSCCSVEQATGKWTSHKCSRSS